MDTGEQWHHLVFVVEAAAVLDKDANCNIPSNNGMNDLMTGTAGMV